MSIIRNVATIILLLTFSLWGAGAGALPVAKAPSHTPITIEAESLFGTGENARFDRCVKKCLNDSRMQAVGIGVLEERCKSSCLREIGIEKSRSDNPTLFTEGVKVLCAHPTHEAFLPLVKALKKELRLRTGVWACIIPALASFRDKRSTDILIEALKTEDDFWLGRESAAMALGEVEDPVAIPALIEAAERYETRAAALTALGKFHDKRVVPPLISALVPEEEKEIREQAYKDLERLGILAADDLIEAIGNLSPDTPEIRRAVWLCELLAKSGDPRAPEVLKKVGQVVSVSGNLAQIMDLKTYEMVELETGDKKLNPGEEVTYWDIEGRKFIE